MKKIIVVVMLIGSMFAGGVTINATDYVTISYNVRLPSGDKPNRVIATAQVTYDSSQNPVHTTFPQAGNYDKTTGIVAWSLPAECYVRFVCQATGLNAIYQIPTSDAYLNDLVPALPPPEPAWTLNYVPYTGATRNVDLGAYTLQSSAVETSALKITSNPAADYYLKCNDAYGNAVWERDVLRELISATNNGVGPVMTWTRNNYTSTIEFGNPAPAGYIGTYIFQINPEDRGEMGYSGALRFKHISPDYGAEFASYYWTGNDFYLELETIDSSREMAQYSFGRSNLTLYNDNTGETYTYYHTGNDTNLAKLDAPNIFSDQQTAPYFRDAEQYNADNPRPYGYPQSVANNLDDEFNDTIFAGWTPQIISGSLTPVEANGYVNFSGTAGAGYYVKSISDGDIRLAIQPSLSYATDIGVVVADSNGNGYGVLMSSESPSYLKIKTFYFSSWGTPAVGTTINYKEAKYIGIRYFNDAGVRKTSCGWSLDGYNWDTFVFANSANVPETIAYIGFYISKSSNSVNGYDSNMRASINWFRAD